MAIPLMDTLPSLRRMMRIDHIKNCSFVALILKCKCVLIEYITMYIECQIYMYWCGFTDSNV